MFSIKFKNLLCLIAKHKLVLDRIYVGKDEWLKQMKCTRCGHTEQKDNITWLSSRKYDVQQD